MHQAVPAIRTAFFINLVFALIELFGGIWTNSIAILSDALHDLGDSLILGLSWYLAYLSQRGKTKSFSYGYKRFSLLGALVSSIVLVAGSAYIAIEAIPRLIHPEQPHVVGMIGLSILGIGINALAAWRLREGHTMNERVMYLHLLEDVLGWFATLIGGVVMYFYYVPRLDAILAIAIAIYILVRVIRNLMQTVRIILQGTPPELNVEEIEAGLRNLEGVHEINDCHVWSMDGDYHILSVHLIVEENLKLSDLQRIKSKARVKLNEMGIDHSTIEFESPDEHYGPC